MQVRTYVGTVTAKMNINTYNINQYIFFYYYLNITHTFRLYVSKCSRKIKIFAIANK